MTKLQHYLSLLIQRRKQKYLKSYSTTILKPKEWRQNKPNIRKKVGNFFIKASCNNKDKIKKIEELQKNKVDAYYKEQLQFYLCKTVIS